MKEVRREVEGKIFSHEAGLGTVTRRMIDERAREIALIEGRSRATKEDQIRARRELLHMRNVRDEMDEVDDELESLDPSETPTHHGNQAINVEADDEEAVQRDLVEQGIEEAEHEQMLEGHLSMKEEDFEDEDGGRRRRKKND